MKKGFVGHIEELTLTNKSYRKVLYTGHHLQLVLMSIPVGCDIGAEVHETHDQFIRVEEGHGYVEIDGVRTALEDDFAVLIPAGAEHNVVNTGKKPMKIYTLYGPPEHRHDVLQETKADDEEEHFDGCTSE